MSRIRLFAVLLFVGAFLAVPLFVFAANPAATGPLTVKLDPLNNSGESGTAVLTDLGGGQTKVDVTVKGEPADGSHPMHIHTGQCGPTLGPVVYPLTNVVGGTSTTTITATLDSLMDGNHAVNVHKSKAEIGTYVACGNIPAAAGAAAQTTGSPTAGATAAATSASTATAAATPVATATGAAPKTAPTTGDRSGDILIPSLLLGLVLLAAGLFARRLARKVL